MFHTNKFTHYYLDEKMVSALLLKGLCGSYSEILLINYILIGTINEVVRRLDANKINRARTISN